METLELYAVKDVVIGRFMSLVPMHNDNEAVRSLKEAGKNVNQLTEKANDIQLWHIGTYDVETGSITNDVYLVGSMIDYVHPSIRDMLSKPNQKLEVSEDGRKED